MVGVGRRIVERDWAGERQNELDKEEVVVEARRRLNREKVEEI